MLLGIDLGTTNSLIGFFDVETKMVKNEFDSYLTPSVVGVDEDGKIVVGEEAIPLLRDKRAVKLFKRDMGTKKKFKLGNKNYTAVQLSAIILNKLIENYKKQYDGEIEGLIISVPAYFNENQRYDTRIAGELTGYSVKRIISEPSAASLYANIVLDDKDDSYTYIVVDLGGGTLDLTVVDYFERIFEIKAIAGDTNLGGEDYTNVLVDMFMKEYPSVNKEDVYLVCEKAKKKFDESEDSIVKIKVGEFEMDITFAQYYEKCLPLNMKMDLLFSKIISDAQIDVEEIDHIIFVGGGSKSLIFRKYIYKLFHAAMDNEKFFLTEESDMYVAYGLVLYTSIIMGEVGYVITDICPFSLGTNVAGNEIMENYYDILINRNAVLPISVTKTYSTQTASQKQVKMSIFQGEKMNIKENLLLGEITLPASGREINLIKLTLTYDINSILEVKVSNTTTGKEYIEYIHHNIELTDIEKKKIQEAFKAQKEIIENEDRYEYYKEILEFKFENAPVYERDYYQDLLLQYSYLKHNTQSKHKILKFEKRLRQILELN